MCFKNKVLTVWVKEVFFLQNDVFKLMFLVTRSISVSSEAFGRLVFFSFLYLFICSTSLILQICLYVLLIVCTVTIDGSLLIIGLHLALFSKNSLLSLSGLTFLHNMNKCTIYISCILISLWVKILEKCVLSFLFTHHAK